MYFVYFIFLFGIWDSFSFCTHPFLNAFWHYTDKENVVTQDGTPFWPTVTIYGIVTRMFRSYENICQFTKRMCDMMSNTPIWPTMLLSSIDKK